MKNILILGGSGVLGSVLVEVLRQQAVTVHIGNRRNPPDASNRALTTKPLNWSRVDLLTGEGLPQALTDIDTVFHFASGPGTVGHEPVETVMTRNLLKAMAQSDVRHLLYSSIVGVDTIPYRYFQAKRQAEALIQRSSVPYTIVRATQFHSFVDAGLHKLFSLPVGFLPRQLQGQPIDVQTVAQEFYRLSQIGSQQAILNIGGPEVFDLGTLVDIYRRYRPVPKLMVPILTVGALMKSFASGQGTCPGDATLSKTWEEYLKEHYGGCEDE